MASADFMRHWAPAWWLALLLPLAVQAGDEPPPERGPAALPEAEFLEFLAEEPGLDEDLDEAAMSDKLDHELDRMVGRNKVNDDDSTQK